MKPRLSEAQIQEQLYGRLGLRKKKSHPQVTPDWTGTEILESELTRLRTELSALRSEREQLVGQLAQMDRTPQQVVSAPRRGSWMLRLTGGVLAILLLGVLLSGTHLLQASPVAYDPAPYTVQVAVYDVRALASDAQDYLRGLGYEAFLVEDQRKAGKLRHRVFVGKFISKAEAERERYRLELDPRFQDFKDAFVLVR